MGCDGQASEFDCVLALGQDAANTAFAKHWGSWTTKDDINEIVSYGLNTIRIPVGYWMHEELVDGSEHFPQGGLEYLKKICGWASDAGLYIIMDLHGAPGAQTKNPFTGQNPQEPGFYTDDNYERALKWLEWMTKLVYTVDELRNVGMLEVVNEPVQDDDKASSMRSKYYPQAVEVSIPSDSRREYTMLMMRSVFGPPRRSSTSTRTTTYISRRWINLGARVIPTSTLMTSPIWRTTTIAT